MRRPRKGQIASVVFDDNARLEFLTGFRKRKLMKKEIAKSKAKERERQDRLQTRREHRQALKERAQENVRLIEGACMQMADVDELDDTEASGSVTSDKGKGKATQEFEDEEQLATVTVVEEFDPEALRHGNPRSQNANDMHPQSDGVLQRPKTRGRTPDHEDGYVSPSRDKKELTQPPHNGNVAYETKAARKVTRSKQLARKFEKADRAGRKVSHKAKKRAKQTNR